MFSGSKLINAWRLAVCKGKASSFLRAMWHGPQKLHFVQKGSIWEGSNDNIQTTRAVDPFPTVNIAYICKYNVFQQEILPMHMLGCLQGNYSNY